MKGDIKTSKMLKYCGKKQAYSHTNSYSSNWKVLPYGFQTDENCHRQYIYRAETGILKNSVNISMNHRAERRFKIK